jgi:hypothetical protein
MSDTTYEVFEDEQAYGVRITRLGEFVQEARASRRGRMPKRGLLKLSVWGS